MVPFFFFFWKKKKKKKWEKNIDNQLKQTREGKNGRKFWKKKVSCIVKFSSSQMFSTRVSLRVILQPTPIYIKFTNLCFCSKWETNPLVSLITRSILFVDAIHHMSNLIMPISYKVIGYWWTWGQLSYVDNVVLFCNAPCCGFGVIIDINEKMRNALQ